MEDQNEFKPNPFKVGDKVRRLPEHQTPKFWEVGSDVITIKEMDMDYITEFEEKIYGEYHWWKFELVD